MHPVAAAGFSSSAGGANSSAYGDGGAMFLGFMVATLGLKLRMTDVPDSTSWMIPVLLLLGPGRTVLDLGAGTGKLTRLLVPTGARVIAVEPLAEMRAKLKEVLPGVEAVDGTAEELPLPDGSVDVITCAQAFHWFDLESALPELHRVLAVDGLLVLVWNKRDVGDPLHRAIEGLLGPHRDAISGQFLEGWRARVEASPLFGPVERRLFQFDQLVTRDDVVGRVASTSFVAAMPRAGRESVLVQVRALVADREEPFAFPYQTEIFVIPSIE